MEIEERIKKIEKELSNVKILLKTMMEDSNKLWQTLIKRLDGSLIQ